MTKDEISKLKPYKLTRVAFCFQNSNSDAMSAAENPVFEITVCMQSCGASSMASRTMAERRRVAYLPLSQKLKQAKAISLQAIIGDS
jgi:hypothetical protein